MEVSNTFDKTSVLFMLSCNFLQLFRGARDRNTVVKNPFKRPFVARFVKFHPVSWYGHISMRVELYGSLVGKLLFIVIRIAFGRRKRF